MKPKFIMHMNMHYKGIIKTWLCQSHNWHIFVSKRLRASSKTIHDTQNEYLPKILPIKTSDFGLPINKIFSCGQPSPSRKTDYILIIYTQWLWLKYFSSLKTLIIDLSGQPFHILILRSILVNALSVHLKQA